MTVDNPHEHIGRLAVDVERKMRAVQAATRTDAKVATREARRELAQAEAALTLAINEAIATEDK